MTTTTDPYSPRAVPSLSEAFEKARRGDRRAFSRLMEPYRRELIAYCYRLTRSLPEAEDLAQETFLRAFRALETFEGRATPRAWLYKIAHNLCVNHVQRRPPPWESLETLDEGRLPAEARSVEAQGEGHEDVRLGFVALMRSLPPRQRASLVLRDVLGWSAEETARILETTVPAVKNALARARQTLARNAHGSDPVQALAASDAAAQALIADWVDAFEKGNTGRMVALLTGEGRTPILPAKHRQTGYNKDTEQGRDSTQKTEISRSSKRSGNRREARERLKERTNGE